MPKAPKQTKLNADSDNKVVSFSDENAKLDYMKGKCAIIGKSIRENRKQRRFSVENLAEFLELSASYIGLLERGDRCPSIKILFKLCDLFGITPNDLMLANPADDAEGQDLKVAENGALYNTKMQIDAIVSLIRTLNESELDFVIDTIKNLKRIGK